MNDIKNMILKILKIYRSVGVTTLTDSKEANE